MIDLKDDLVGISDLQKRASSVVNRTVQTQRPTFITHHGKAVAAILDLDQYNRLVAARLELEAIHASQQVAAQLQEGHVYSSSEVRALMDQWQAQNAQAASRS